MLQNRSCCLSLQGKYTDISAIEMYLPLMHLPRLSKEVHLIEADYSARKFVIGISGYRGERSCCTPCLVECWGENNDNSFEEVLPAIFTTKRIVLEDMVAANVDVKFVTFFPCLLQ